MIFKYRLEGKAIIVEQKILYVSSSAWTDPKEEHIMIELLSGSNDVIWVNPFGPINGPILPNIYEVKERLTVYHPGMKFLALPSLMLLNEKRRLLQVVLYLIGRDFEPDIVIIDDPLARCFAVRYGKRGALTLYYAGEIDREDYPDAERNQLLEAIDLVYKPGKLPAEMTEDDFIAALYKRLEEVSRLIVAKKAEAII